MRPYHKIIIPSVGFLEGVAELQTLSESGDLVLNGNLVSNGVAIMDLPRHVLIGSTADERAATFTVVGTNRYGRLISEEMAGPNAGLVQTRRNFSTVTQVSIDRASTDRVSAGSSNTFEMEPYLFDHYGAYASYTVVGAFGPQITWLMQYTMEDLLHEGTGDGDTLDWLQFEAPTTETIEFIKLPLVAIRPQITIVAGGSGICFHVLEAMVHLS